MKKVKYVEPADYFPKEIRKELGLGEFAKEEPEEEPDPSGQDSDAEKKTFRTIE